MIAGGLIAGGSRLTAQQKGVAAAKTAESEERVARRRQAGHIVPDPPRLERPGARIILAPQQAARGQPQHEIRVPLAGLPVDLIRPVPPGDLARVEVAVGEEVAHQDPHAVEILLAAAHGKGERVRVAAERDVSRQAVGARAQGTARILELQLPRRADGVGPGRPGGPLPDGEDQSPLDQRHAVVLDQHAGGAGVHGPGLRLAGPGRSLRRGRDHRQEQRCNGNRKQGSHGRPHAWTNSGSSHPNIFTRSGIFSGSM